VHPGVQAAPYPLITPMRPHAGHAVGDAALVDAFVAEGVRVPFPPHVVVTD